MEILTEKQEAVLNFIEEYQLNNGKSPTIKEMKEFFQVSSDNSILKHLKALEEKGFIEKDDTPRGIKPLQKIQEKLQAKTSSLPLLGFIPAGGPIMTDEYVQAWMDIGADNIKDQKQSFLLRVRGDSMVDAGIYHNDIIIASGSMGPRDNDIVVALVDNENTVKRFVRKRGKKPYLKPENKRYKKIYPLTELIIQGVVTGLIRSY